MFCTGTRFVFEELAVSTRFDAGVSMSPIVNGSGGAEVFGKSVWLVRSEITGELLKMLTKKTLLADKPSGSVTVIVMAASPSWSCGGVRVKVRFVPPPLITMPVCKFTRFVFDDCTVTWRFSAGLSASPMVKGMGP